MPDCPPVGVVIPHIVRVMSSRRYVKGCKKAKKNNDSNNSGDEDEDEDEEDVFSERFLLNRLSKEREIRKTCFMCHGDIKKNTKWHNVINFKLLR